MSEPPRNQLPPEPNPPNVIISTVTIKRDDSPKYVYPPARPLG